MSVTNVHNLFDGQTLVIEDMLTIAPDYAANTRSLVEKSARYYVVEFVAEWQTAVA